MNKKTRRQQQTEIKESDHAKKLFRTIVLFAVFMFVLLWLLNLAYHQVVIVKKLQYKEEQTYQDFIMHNKLDVLFLGDSLTDYAVHPAYVQNSFNLAFPSNTYIENYVKLKKTVEKDKKVPQVVFLEIDPHSFSSYMLVKVITPLRNDPWYYKDFVPLRQRAQLANQSMVKAGFLSVFPFIGNGDDFFIPKTPSGGYLGWINRTDDFSQMNMSAVAEERVVQQFDGSRRLDPLLMEYFVKALVYAREHNIKVILIRYPQTRIYQETLARHNISSDEDMKAILKSAREVGVTEFWDYTNAFVNSTSYFENADHLNWKGAIMFSRQLHEDINASGVLHTSEKPAS